MLKYAMDIMAEAELPAAVVEVAQGMSVEFLMEKQ